MSDVLDLVRELLRLESDVDSLEIGSASKGGVIKVYGSFDDPESFRKKIDAALEARRYAREKMEAGPP